MNIRVIVNPSAGAGSTRQKIPQLKRLFEEQGARMQVCVTERPGHATDLARRALADGVDVLAVMGGDGTFNEVAQAYLGAAGPVCGPALALIPAGTGGDLRRSLQLSNDLPAAVERILRRQTVKVDLGSLAARATSTLTPQHYAFLNVAGVGISAVVCRLANDGPKWLGGKLIFYSASLCATFTYNNIPLSVIVDGSILYEGPTYLVALANGQYFGGGMHIAPQAHVDDGLLDVVVLGDYSKAAAVGLSRAIYAGTHLQRAQTYTARGARIEVRLHPTARLAVDGLIEMDGQVPAAQLPVVARIHPSALDLCI